ncbi:thiol S-methyltransferase TMT1A-like isoform X1 [Pituophis catenifer annectens]|uniref:thiol S-methyltransferase TMT1A-like isoform X1 n=1 Tax=Pituophis catenifer annectens TaxID=94852 RepID=UPI00399496F0
MLVLILQQCMKIFILPIYVLAYLGLWDPICKRIFPVFMNQFSKLYHMKMHKEKETLFKNMQDFADSSGKLHLLEIGVGTGTNFQFYPPNSHVTCLDYNPNFRNFLLQGMAQNTHLQFENFLVSPAENMSSVSDNSMDVVVGTLVFCSVNSTQAALKEILRVLRPSMAQNTHLQFENFVVTPAENMSSVLDNSMDVVVGTLVFCSVNSPQAALKEILRVLRPGGAFYFIEHVAAGRSTWTYFWQQVCEPTWRHVADGCSLLKETWKDLENAGFSKLNLQHIIAVLSPSVIGPHIYGYAVK